MSQRTSAEMFCDEYAAYRVLRNLTLPIDPELLGLGQSEIIQRYAVGSRVTKHEDGSLATISFVDDSSAILIDGENRSPRWEVVR